MTINVYDTIMPGPPAESYNDHGMTVEEWIEARAPGYKRGPVQPVSCSINGTVIKPTDWHTATIREHDVVEFRVVPRGGAFDFITAALFPGIAGSVFAAQSVMDMLSPDMPGRPGPGQQGQQLESASARANTARLGEQIPEQFGRYIRYPDYLNQPRRYYRDTRTHVLELMLSVGAGEYEIEHDKVNIGQTPMKDLDGVSYQIFPPGADVSGVTNHQNWYNAPEVGATQASAGIRLKGVTQGDRTFSGSGNTSGSTISGISVGEYWAPGAEGSISFRQNVSVFDGGPTDPDYMIGNFQHLEQGQTVTATGTLALSSLNGNYVVSSLTEGKTVLSLETTEGEPVNLIDSSLPGYGTIRIDKAGTKYRILSVNSSSSIGVERILNSGAADPQWSTLPALSSVSTSITWEADTMTGFQAGPFAACPPGETTTRLEFDIFAPQGLGIIDGEDIDPRTRTIRVEWRPVGGTTWTAQNFNVSGATRDQLGWTFTINLPSAVRPEVRISRLGGESVATTSLDRLELTGLKAMLPTVTRYPGVTTMAVTIEGSDEIGRSSENRINLVGTRKLPPVAGGPLSATRSISRAAAYVARSLGRQDEIDVSEFERLDALWEGRGDTFDYVFSDGTAKQAIDTILNAGFASMTLDRGVIVPVRDEPRTQFEEGYSPENMTSPLRRSVEVRQVDEPDGVEVEFTREGTWTEETIRCLLPGDNGFKLDKVKLDGVTDPVRAWRIGMRRRRIQRYRRRTYEFSTELDALNSRYLSYVPLLDDIPGYGKVAILRAIYDDRILVSEPLEWEPGKAHVVAYRDENGDTVGPFSATRGDDDYTVMVTIPKPWPAALPSDREQTHIYFGTTERWCFPALITEIRPTGPLETSVTATNYDDRVYADDDESPSEV